MDTLNIQEYAASASNLLSCPDCGNMVSQRAESCPNCGRFFQSLRLTEVIGRNWTLRIAWGIILGYLGILVINAILFFTVGALFFGALSNAISNSPTYAPRSR